MKDYTIVGFSKESPLKVNFLANADSLENAKVIKLAFEGMNQFDRVSFFEGIIEKSHLEAETLESFVDLMPDIDQVKAYAHIFMYNARKNEKLIENFHHFFDLVKNGDNWKLPTDYTKTISITVAAMNYASMVWFAGGAEIEENGGEFKISCKGYYYYIGA